MVLSFPRYMHNNAIVLGSEYVRCYWLFYFALSNNAHPSDRKVFGSALHNVSDRGAERSSVQLPIGTQR